MFDKKINQVFEELKSDYKGLTLSEAEERLKFYSKNELEKVKKQSFTRRFFKQFLNVMILILLASSIISISLALIRKEYSDLFEAFVILFIVVINAFIGVFQESKAQACIEDLQKYTKTIVNVKRGGTNIKIDSSELVPGDIVEMEAGNVVMADIRLFEANNFSCDESSLTGESVPVEKNVDVILNKLTPLAERKNMAYSGSLITSGKAKGVVVATGRNTELGKIANVLFNSKIV